MLGVGEDGPCSRRLTVEVQQMDTNRWGGGTKTQGGSELVVNTRGRGQCRKGDGNPRIAVSFVMILESKIFVQERTGEQVMKGSCSQARGVGGGAAVGEEAQRCSFENGKK